MANYINNIEVVEDYIPEAKPIDKTELNIDDFEVIPALSPAELIEDFELIDRPEPAEKGFTDLFEKTIFLPNEEQRQQAEKEQKAQEAVVQVLDKNKYFDIIPEAIKAPVQDYVATPVTSLKAVYDAAPYVKEATNDIINTHKLSKAWINVGTITAVGFTVASTVFSSTGLDGIAICGIAGLSAGLYAYDNLNKKELTNVLGKATYAASFLPIPYIGNMPAVQLPTQHKNIEALTKLASGANIPKEVVGGVAPHMAASIALRRLSQDLEPGVAKSLVENTASSLEQTTEKMFDSIGDNVINSFKTIADKNSYESAKKTVNRFWSGMKSYVPQVKIISHNEVDLSEASTSNSWASKVTTKASNWFRS